MNSSSRGSETSHKGSSLLNNYQFDFGIGSNRSSSGSLNNQKNQTARNPSSTFQSKPTSSSSSSSWTANKPSWTHQPIPNSGIGTNLSNPTSMVGDIFGKSWTSTATMTQGSRIGITESNHNLFGDLVGTALGQGKNNGNVPLKNSAPSAQKNSFSMGNFSDALPKSGNKTPSPISSNSGSVENIGSYISSNHYSQNSSVSGPSMKSGSRPMSTGNSKGDPFESLADFRYKQMGSTPPKVNNRSTNNTFGDVQNSKKDESAFAYDSSFGAFQDAPVNGASAFPSDPFSYKINNNQKVSNFDSVPKTNDYKIPDQTFFPQDQTSHSKSVDPLDMLFSSSASSHPMAEGSRNQPTMSGVDDWGLGSEFGGGDVGGDTDGTTDIDGLPPPPAGISVSMAKNKGLDNHKQGQYAEAIKWLSWAIVLLEKSGGNTEITEVLSCRASCYKEVGEYKKAITDCSEVLKHDGTNIAVLLQRALLYESTEKYKLGAQDLREVLKLDPSNRLAKSTIHRLIKLAG